MWFQEVPPEKGKMVLKIIHNYKHATSIFDDFIHYEKRQEEDEVRKPTPKVKIICLRFHVNLILNVCRIRHMIEEEGMIEELMTDEMVAEMTETIGEETTDGTIGGTTGIIETVIGNMEEEELEAIIIAVAEIITVNIAVRMGSAMVIATVIVTVFREKQVEGGGEETEVIEGGMVTELVDEEAVGVGVAAEEGNKASSDLCNQFPTLFAICRLYPLYDNPCGD